MTATTKRRLEFSRAVSSKANLSDRHIIVRNQEQSCQYCELSLLHSAQAWDLFRDEIQLSSYFSKVAELKLSLLIELAFLLVQRNDKAQLRSFLNRLSYAKTCDYLQLWAENLLNRWTQFLNHQWHLLNLLKIPQVVKANPVTRPRMIWSGVNLTQKKTKSLYKRTFPSTTLSVLSLPLQAPLSQWL